MDKIHFSVSAWRRTLSLLLLCCVGAGGTAYAGEITGQVGRLDTVAAGGGAPNNYDFRVYLVGSTVICNGQTWAYVNSGEVNYNTIVANLLAAAATGASVGLIATQDSLGFCHLDYLVVGY